MPASPTFTWTDKHYTGLPFSTESVDVDSLTYWTTLSGYNKDSGADVTDEEILESRALAVKWWWLLHKVTFTGSCSYTSGNYGSGSASLPGTATTVTYGIDDIDEFLTPTQVETGVFSPEDRHCLLSRFSTPEGHKYNFTEIVDNGSPPAELTAYCFGSYNSNGVDSIFKSFFLDGEFVGIGFRPIDNTLTQFLTSNPLSLITQVRDPTIYALAALGGAFGVTPPPNSSLAYTSVSDGADTWHGVGGARWGVGASFTGSGTVDGATMSASVSVSMPDDPEVEETDDGLEAEGSVSISSAVECYT